MPIKFLFINAVNPAKEVETMYPPLGIGYLISSLRKKFGEDAAEYRVINDRIEEELESFKPDLVGISAVSQNFNRAIAYASAAKKRGVPVICGGVHISMLPSSLTRDMDVAVMGEGEETVCELFELFRSRGGFPEDGLAGIKGVAYLKGEEVVTTGSRPPIAPLDKLPFPARDQLSITAGTYLFTSRGCPYRCVFCASTRFWDKLRFFTAEYVAEEIERLVRDHKVRYITFYDDIFPADAERVRRLVAILKEKKLLGAVEFSCTIRSNMVNEVIVGLLGELGIKAVGMGLESGCDKTLEYLKGGHITVADHARAIGILKSHGMAVNAGFIIGSPGETESDIMETYNFIRDNKIDAFSVNVLTPLPGTPVWYYAAERGLVNDKMDWDRLNVSFADNSGGAIILSEKVSRERLLELFDKFERLRKRLLFRALVKRTLRTPVRAWGYFRRRFFSRPPAGLTEL